MPVYKKRTGGYALPRNAAAYAKPENPLRTTALPAPEFDDATDLPVDADAPERRRPLVPFSDALNAVLKHFNIESRLENAAALEAMVKAWPEVAGKDLAARLELEKYDRNILYVLARNNTELFEIRQFKLRALEARAKKHPAFATLRQIRVRCR